MIMEMLQIRTYVCGNATDTRMVVAMLQIRACLWQCYRYVRCMDDRMSLHDCHGVT